MKTKTHHDFCVVGNGAIAATIACCISRHFQDKSIALVGDYPRINSASAAAGAMHAVFGEIEDDINSAEDEKTFFEVGLKSKRLWLELLDTFSLKNTITSNKTIVYLQKNPSNFELKNYNSVVNASMQYSTGTILNKSELSELFSHASIKPEEAIEIVDEFAISSPALLRGLDHSLSKTENVSVIRAHCDSIEAKNEHNEITVLCKDIAIKCSRLIVAAGSNSFGLLREYDMQPMVQSVGAALELNNVPNEVMHDRVIRSVNRGGAQCGIHIVPRFDSIYVGAGSYVVPTGVEPRIRADTVRYLLETSENEYFGREIAYKALMNIVVGSRPRSLDGFPLIGPLRSNTNIYVATATNRVGLTWAPVIAQGALDWLGSNKVTDFEEIATILKRWLPDRSPIPFGTSTQCIDYYTSTRISNQIEHGLLKRDANHNDATTKIRAHGLQLMNEVNKKLSIAQDGSIHPDSWSSVVDPKFLQY